MTRVAVVGDFDPHALEAFRLEVARLARRYGGDVVSVRVARPRSAS